MPVPIQFTAAGLDLSSREGDTGTVVASPSGAAETIIASLTLPTDVVVEHGVLLLAFAAWTVGTSGTASNVRIRKTNVSGTIVQATGALTTAAASLQHATLLGLDTSPAGTGQVYVVTLTVTAGAAASTVSAVELAALII